MYCPNCGKQNASDQRFCRSCGLKLQQISQIVTDELSGTTTSGQSIERAERGPKRLPPILLPGFLVMMSGIIVAVVGKQFLFQPMIASVGSLLAILGIGLIGFQAMMLLRPSGRSLRPEVLPRPVNRTVVDDGSIPSVTELTTRHLEATIETDKPRTTQPST